MNRRRWLEIVAAGIPLAAAQASKPRRVAIIGHTGAGNYGHDWDIAWNGLDGVTMVAVADPDAAGRSRAAERSRAQRSYADYREMLQKEKPDFVGICPHAPDERLAMARAAAEVGAHMMIEKPIAQDVAAADEIVRLADRHRLKIQVGLPMRTQPAVLRALQMLEAGDIGIVQEIRTRGKEDRRAGGEDMAMLGPHLFDLMRFFGGDPQWVMAHVTEDGREISRTTRPTEPVGLIAGNQVASMFAFANGIHGYFSSKNSDVQNGSRFGIFIYGSKGAIFMGITKYPEVALQLKSPSWLAAGRGAEWQPIETSKPLGREESNTLLVRDLIHSVEHDREPACNAANARWTLEMLQGVYSSQLNGSRISLPLKERRHPLERL
jgi:predicted dehydrogenase